MRSIRSIAIVFGAVFMFAAGCTGKDQVKKILEDNPDVLADAIKKNPDKIMMALKEASQSMQKMERDQQAEEESKQLEEEFKSPKVPEITDNRVIFGNKNAPITIVEYSDFECPFCSRGYQVVQQVKDKYGDKVRVIYKHLPLNFHPLAEPAARFYEAIALQDAGKAEKFHDLVFQNQDRLKTEKDGFLKEMAKKVGADVKKAVDTLNSPKVSEIIKKDMAEAEKFGFTGTPGFLVNGVSIRGAYPIEHFQKIIDRHLGGK